MKNLKPTRFVRLAVVTFVVFSFFNACTTNQTKINLIYLNEGRLEKVKELIEKQDAYFTEAYAQLIVDADFLLEQDRKYLGVQPFRTYSGMKYQDGFSDHLPIYADFYVLEKASELSKCKKTESSLSASDRCSNIGKTQFG